MLAMSSGNKQIDPAALDRALDGLRNIFDAHQYIPVLHDDGSVEFVLDPVHAETKGWLDEHLDGLVVHGEGKNLFGHVLGLRIRRSRARPRMVARPWRAPCCAMSILA